MQNIYLQIKLEMINNKTKKNTIQLINLITKKLYERWKNKSNIWIKNELGKLRECVNGKCSSVFVIVA